MRGNNIEIIMMQIQRSFLRQKLIVIWNILLSFFLGSTFGSEKSSFGRFLFF